MSDLLPDPQSLLAHEGGLRRIAHGLLRDRDLADDAVQETWLAALSRDPAAASGPAWLRGVTRKVALKALRKEARRRQRERVAARVEIIQEQESTRRRVLAAVLALDEPYRRTVLMRFFEELPPREIARREAVPTETVRTRLRRGLDKVRQRMLRELGPEGERDAWPLVALAFDRGASHAASAVLSQIAGVSAVTSKAKILVAGLVILLALPILWFAFFAEDEPEAPRLGSRSGAAGPATGNTTPGDTPPADSGEPAAIASTPFEAERPEAPPEPAASAFGTLIATVTWKKDGSPARNAEVEVMPWGAVNPFFHTTWRRTDAEGILRLERLPPGTVDLGAHFGGRVRAKVKAGEETEVTLEIPEGFSIVGRVVDATDHPVPGARIILSDGMSMMEGREVARSDAAGRFKIPSVASKSWRTVGARADAYAPSPMTILSAAVGEQQEVKLVLAHPGAAVEGVVTDPEGRPVVGAKVRAGSEGFDQIGLPDGRRAMKAGPVETRTDEAGRFRFAGLHAGPATVAVRDAKWAPWKEKLDLVAGTRRKLEIVLETPVSLSGTILKADGKPAARLAVQVNGYGDFLSSFVRTRADGTYEIGGLAPGEIKVEVETDAHGRAKGTLQGAPGQALVWNARLEKGGRISGQIVDEARRPLRGWSVNIQALHKGRYEGDHTYTDEEGRFSFDNCQVPSYTLQVSERLPGEEKKISRRPAVRRHGVKTNAEPLEIVITRDLLSSVFITGRILSPDGKVVEGTIFSLPGERDGNSELLKVDPETGRFRSGPFPPGRYALHARAPGYPPLRVARRSVSADETWDLGTVRFQEGGRVKVTIEGSIDGIDLSKVWLLVRPLQGSGRQHLDLRERSVTSGPLTPGTHELVVSGLVVGRDRHEFDITAGGTTELRIGLVKGLKRTLRIAAPSGTRPTGKATIRVLDAAGRRLGSREITPREGKPIQWAVRLAAGQAYRAEVDWGPRSGSLEFAVEAAAEGAETLEIALQ